MGNSNRREIRMVLVGKTGTGKSSLGNSLLKKQFFLSKSSAISVTKDCRLGKRHLRDGIRLVVVDTPGIFDTRNNITETSKEVARCISLTLPGPHIFVLVLKIGRYTQEELDTIQSLRDLFGEHVLKYVIVVFNGKDALEYDGITIDQHIESSPQQLRSLIHQCKGRVASINNRAESDYILQSDVTFILQLAKQTIQDNNGTNYTGELFEAAKYKAELKILRRELELEQEVRRREMELEPSRRELELEQRILGLVIKHIFRRMFNFLFAPDQPIIANNSRLTIRSATTPSATSRFRQFASRQFDPNQPIVNISRPSICSATIRSQQFSPDKPIANNSYMRQFPPRSFNSYMRQFPSRSFNSYMRQFPSRSFNSYVRQFPSRSLYSYMRQFPSRSFAPRQFTTVGPLRKNNCTSR